MNEDDIKRASKKVNEYHQEKAQALNGHNVGTVSWERIVSQSRKESGEVIH